MTMNDKHKVNVIEGRPDHGWKLVKTKIILDPAVMLLLDLEQNESSICHDLLDICSIDKNEDVDELIHKVKHIFELLVQKPSTAYAQHEHERLRKKLVERLQSKQPDDKKLTRRGVTKLLREKQLALFNRPLEIYVNNTFDAKHILKVNLHFLPDDFFFHKGMEKVLECIQSGRAPADRMPCGLHYCEAPKSFRFGHHERLTEFLQSVMEKVMITYGHADSSNTFSWQLGLLWTPDGARQQDPHVDYEHKSMLREEQRWQKCQGRKRKPTLPYSMDLPLQRGGLKINYYGIPQEKLYEVPLLVECPFKQCVVWRGDAVHGGGHLDLLGGGGFRCHGYLHMGHNSGMSLTVLPKIDWFDIFRKNRYSSYLKLCEGDSFPKGNDKY